MKTTEIFVEQVLIGFVAVAIIALPVIDIAKIGLSWESLGTGIIILAIAYLLGIVIDRMTDTLLSRPNAVHRLVFISEDRPKAPPKDDLFPEGAILAKILASEGQASNWTLYLRSRIRLTRSLAALLPALTLSSILAVSRHYDLLASETSGILLGCMALVYLVCLIDTNLALKPNGVAGSVEKERKKIEEGESKERTGEKEKAKHSQPKKVRFRRQRLTKIPRTFEFKSDDTVPRLFRYREPVVYGSVLLAIEGIVLTVFFVLKASKDSTVHWVLVASGEFIRIHSGAAPWKVVAILLFGGAFSALSAWSWWRITKTFMRFLMTCYEEGLLERE